MHELFCLRANQTIYGKKNETINILGCKTSFIHLYGRRKHRVEKQEVVSNLHELLYCRTFHVI